MLIGLGFGVVFGVVIMLALVAWVDRNPPMPR